MAMEIERKFLLPELPPELRPRDIMEIRQGYLSRESDREVRIRQMGRKQFLTVKIGSGQTREEREILIPAAGFEELWPLCAGRQLYKTRSTLALDRILKAEVDHYQGVLAGLVTVEVEFPDTASAEAFAPPWWFGPELTADERFSNGALASLNQETARQTLGGLLDPPSARFGCVPLIDLEGERRVILISARSSQRWIFPKGCPEDHLDEQGVALMEAREEAGVDGRLYGGFQDSYYWKDFQCQKVRYWPLEVSTLSTQWPESSFRKRRICSPDEARGLLENPYLIRVLDHALAQTATR